jgi:hypothetical protein
MSRFLLREMPRRDVVRRRRICHEVIRGIMAFMQPGMAWNAALPCGRRDLE